MSSFAGRIFFCLYLANIFSYYFPVNEFTKKTGDFCVLSAADVKVLALAYEMEVETHGSDHLRTEPLQRVTNTQVTVPVKELTEEQSMQKLKIFIDNWILLKFS